MASIIAAHISGLSKFRSATSFHPVPSGEIISPSGPLVYQSGCSYIQALSQDVWFATQSMITAMSLAWHSRTRDLKSSTVPNSGFTER